MGESLVIARLTCLMGATRQDLDDVMKAWEALEVSIREIIAEWFLRDGIDHNTFVFAFLPTYLKNSRANSCIGLAGSLRTLCKLIGALCSAGCADKEEDTALVVDMTEYAKAAEEAQ